MAFVVNVDVANNTGFAIVSPQLTGLSIEEEKKFRKIFIGGIKSYIRDYDAGKIEL